MNDDHRARSPGRGRDHEPGAFRDRDCDLDHQRDDSYRLRQGRRDNSRSSPRHDSYVDARERPSRHHREVDRAGDFDDRYRGRDDGFLPRRRDDSRRSHYDGRDERDYESMYDEARQGRDDDRYRSRYRAREDQAFSRDGYHRHQPDNGHTSLSPRDDRYVGNSSRNRVHDAGRPTDTVMLEGLPSTVSASNLREGLFASSIAAEFPGVDVRVTSSRGGKCRAFVQFQQIEHATSFVKEHYPRLQIFLPQSTDDVPDGKISVYIHYTRSNGESGNTHPSFAVRDADWECLKCGFSNFATRAKCKECSYVPSATGGPEGRTGAADVGREFDQKVQILVVHPLPSCMDEDSFANEMKRLELVKSDKPKDEAPKLKSTAPSADGAGYGARPGSLHRVFLMRNAVTNAKFEYGFVEFRTLKDALDALKKFQMTRSFEIGGVPVKIASIHLGVFIPEDRLITPEIEYMSFTPLFNPTLRIRYRDLELYPSQKIVAPNPPDDADAKPSREKADPTKAKKRKADESLAESAAKKTPMVSQIEFWQRRREEIRGDSLVPAEQTTADGLNRTGSIKFSMSGVAKPSTSAKTPPADTEAQIQEVHANSDVSFVDRERLQCLLCMMKYKSVEEVNIHERSRNHKTAIRDEGKVKLALPRVAKRDGRLQKSEGGKYRDRAKERREAHNQPGKPAAPPGKTRPNTEQEKEEIKKPAESKGMGMLAKMGWTAGSGLGAQGEGLTQALTASAYKGGVGLGAEGGKLGDAAEMAESQTVDSYSSYLTAAQKKARERYNQLE